MRFIVATTLVMLLGCAGLPSSHEPDLEQRLTELLQERPDDPDLLFLCRTDSRHKDECRRLIKARSTPLVLARITWEFSGRFNDEDQRYFQELLEVWSDVDPGNAMPRVLKGLSTVSGGDLPKGVAYLVKASKMPALRTYSVEARREAFRILRAVGLDDILNLGAAEAFTHPGLTLDCLAGIRLLRNLAFEHELRGKIFEALETAEAADRLSTLLLSGTLDSLEATVAVDQVHSTTAYVWDLQNRAGQTEAAEASVQKLRRVWRESSLVRRALKRNALENPLFKAVKDSGFDWNAKSRDAFYALLRIRENEVRPYWESTFERGNVAVAMDQLTEDDRREVEASKAPIDRYFELLPSLQASHEKLMVLLNSTRKDEWDETDEFVRERAFHRALGNSADPKFIETLQKWSRDLKTDSLSSSCRVVLVAAGVFRIRDLPLFGADYEDYEPGEIWAVAQTGLKEAIPRMLADFTLETWTGSLQAGSGTGIPLYFALRDLTDQDFGFKADAWEEWGKKNGHLKSGN